MTGVAIVASILCICIAIPSYARARKSAAGADAFRSVIWWLAGAAISAVIATATYFNLP